jgi:NAD+ diphosphatase
MRYCPECGNTLVARLIDGVERKACNAHNCNYVHWDNPVPVVAALVQYKGGIVLARNAQWRAGIFSLVTGYLERNETPEQAVVREVSEEIGLDGAVDALIGCYSLARKNQIILAHSVVATGELCTGEEIAEVKILSRGQLRRWQFGHLTLTADVVSDWLARSETDSRADPFY